IELMIPLTFGAQVVRLYGAVALKLKALFTAVTVLLCLTEVKVPTAYIVPPHCTSWRTCSTEPVALSCGVLAGVYPATPAGGRLASPVDSNGPLEADASPLPVRTSPAPRTGVSNAGISRCIRRIRVPFG